MRTNTRIPAKDLNTTPINELEAGQYFYFARLRGLVGIRQVVRLKDELHVLDPVKGVTVGIGPILHTDISLTLPVDGPDGTLEEAVEAATPKALTFGDLKPGERFRNGVDEFLKIEPQGARTAVWITRYPGSLCMYEDHEEVERITEEEE